MYILTKIHEYLLHVSIAMCSHLANKDDRQPIEKPDQIQPRFNYTVRVDIQIIELIIDRTPDHICFPLGGRGPTCHFSYPVDGCLPPVDEDIPQLNDPVVISEEPIDCTPGTCLLIGS